MRLEFPLSQTGKVRRTYSLQSFLVRLSENSRKIFIEKGISGIIEEGDPNEVYQRIRQSADDNGDMEH